MSLERLFDPSSIAVVGASTTEGKIGYAALRNAAEFDGPVYPVNPKRAGEEAFGRTFVESIAEAGRVDLALSSVPPPAVPDVIEECGEIGVGGVVIYSGGFGEAGEEGAELEASLTEAANRHGIALLGPNTSGFVNPGVDVRASFVPHMEKIESGNVAVVAQSGGINHALAFNAYSEGRGLSLAVGLGNRANTGFREVIEYLDDDPETGAIVLHLEGVADPRGLLETCRAAETPVIAYKVGQEAVDDFAASHTGSLTGDFELYRAGLAQYGVPVVESTTELLDAGTALATAPAPGGTNVGVISAQAGPGIAIADRLQRHGADLPELAAETQERVEEIVGDITYTENPVDTGRPMPELGEVIGAVAHDPTIDAVLVYELYEEGVPYPIDALSSLAGEIDKPIVFATDGPREFVAEEIDRLRSVGVPAYTTPERGADAVGALVQYHERNAPPGGEIDD